MAARQIAQAVVERWRLNCGSFHYADLEDWITGALQAYGAEQKLIAWEQADAALTNTGGLKFYEARMVVRGLIEEAKP